MLTTIFASRGTCIGVAVLELLLERRRRPRSCSARGARLAHDRTSSCSPQWRQTRTRRPLSSVLWPDPRRLVAVRCRRASPCRSRSGCAMSMIPPWVTFGVRSFVLELWRGFVWRFAMLMPSTTTAVAGERRHRRPAAAELRPRLLLALLVRDDALDGAALAGVLAGRARRRCRRCGSRAPWSALGWTCRAAITAPPARGTRSSCSSGRAARGRPARRSGCRADCPGC